MSIPKPISTASPSKRKKSATANSPTSKCARPDCQVNTEPDDVFEVEAIVGMSGSGTSALCLVKWQKCVLSLLPPLEYSLKPMFLQLWFWRGYETNSGVHAAVWPKDIAWDFLQGCEGRGPRSKNSKEWICGTQSGCRCRLEYTWGIRQGWVLENQLTCFIFSLTEARTSHYPWYNL